MASIAERSEQSAKPYTVRWREGGSNRRRSFARKKEAQAWKTQADAIEQSERDGRWHAPASARKQTLADLWVQWTDTRQHLSSATVDKDRWVWQRWLKPELGTRKVGSITRQDLERLLAKVSASGSGADTRIAVYSRLNMALDMALGHDGHDCRRATAGTSKRKRNIRPLDDAELALLLSKVPDRHRLMVDTLATLGLRPKEALDLVGADVDGGKVTVRSTKNGVTRTLPLPEHLSQPLTQHARQAGPDGRLFGLSDYRTWRRRVWKPAAAAAGLQAVPYDLRHTCASKLIAAGATPTDVAEWLGHDVSVTLGTYSHLFAGRKEELASLLDR